MDARLTHYERYVEIYRDSWTRAEKIVAQHGWDALPYALEVGPFVMSAAINILALRAFNEVGKPYSTHKFMTHPELFRVMSAVSGALSNLPGMSEERLQMEVMTQLAQLWHFAAHKAEGERVYEVTPALTERLKATELRGLKSEDLQLPYPAIYLSVPRGQFKVWNHQTEWHDVEGVYVAESTRPTDEGEGREWRVLVVGYGKNDNPLDDALFHFTVPLPLGVEIEESLTREQQRVISKYAASKYIRAYGTEWLVMFRWIMNVVHYATYPEARKEEVWRNKEARQLRDRIQKLPKNSGKRDDLKQRLKTLNPMRRTVLGVGVPPLERGDGEGTQLTIRILVQGHWKNQAHGPQHSLRKRMWIEPYWRGPDVVEEPGRHVLK